MDFPEPFDPCLSSCFAPSAVLPLGSVVAWVLLEVSLPTRREKNKISIIKNNKEIKVAIPIHLEFVCSRNSCSQVARPYSH